MTTPQRLVVCLDGTWNNRDDRTNVSHHFDLVVKGLVPRRPGSSDQILQRKYYDAGVGTGLLDRVSGGGFGSGLDLNVREAYDWLAANYRDDRDEIFVFGFSRGAYTARSLVGFIGRCGLLRHGAPLSITQLWRAYCLLGREHEQRVSLSERLFGAGRAPFREINQLVTDPWNGARPLADDLNDTERLLVQWSRRVKITYLGLYDTVGAMGIDALAIPTLKSRIALHHNMRPTSLIQHCRHALALDEHRSSFSHTPFLAYLGHGPGRAHKNRQPPPTNAQLQAYWEKAAADWGQRIEQRWFVGAHANIGGGYENNLLADLPLRWVLAGAQDPTVGLACEPIAGPAARPPLPPPQDSFAEFARPFWALLFRAKRNYRRLSPPDEARASARHDFTTTDREPGFSLASINEQIDDTVWDHYAQHPPPHLVEFAARTNIPAGRLVAEQRCPHPWAGAGFGPYAVTALLSALASFGFVAAARLFAPGAAYEFTAPRLAAGAMFLAIADWGESWMNFQLARHSGPPARRAFCDGIYWTRLFSVVLSFLGLAYLIAQAWMQGWRAGAYADLGGIAQDHFLHQLPAALGGAGSVTLLLALGGAGARRARDLVGALVGGAALLLVTPAALALGYHLGRVLAPLHWHWPLSIDSGVVRDARFAGVLLLLQLVFLYFCRALAWCSEPMDRANLGLMLPLQRIFTPAQFRAVFATWRRLLACPWRPAAERQMQAVVRESLARDAIGFVPVYVGLFLFGLNFGLNWLEWKWLGRTTLFALPLWIVWPFATALFDYLEDVLHWIMLRLDTQKLDDPAAPDLDRGWAWLLTLPAGVCSVAKFAGAIGATALTLGAIYRGTWMLIFDRMDAGWRAIPVLLLSTAGLACALATIVGVVWFQCRLGRTFARWLS